jgi:hypothetical protein
MKSEPRSDRALRCYSHDGDPFSHHELASKLLTLHTLEADLGNGVTTDPRQIGQSASVAMVRLVASDRKEPARLARFKD